MTVMITLQTYHTLIHDIAMLPYMNKNRPKTTGTEDGDEYK